MPYRDDAFPGTTWSRMARRAAGSLGAAVVLAGVVPAVANAAGLNVANPVAMALQASGDRISEVLGGDADCEVLDTVAPDGTTPSPAPSPADCADENHGAVVSTVAHCAPRGSDPLLSVDGAPATHGEYVRAAAQGEELETPWGTFDLSTAEGAEQLCAALEAARASASPSPSESESDEPGDENHGQIVRTVAKCAPKGKDPLLSVDGAPSNHGGYVKVAAHGDTLSTPWGTFDLSTMAGAEQLCAALEAARATTSPEPKVKGPKDKKDKGGRGRPATAGKGD